VRIAYASPLPPLTSGIADYSAELAPALADAGAELDLWFEGRTPPAGELAARFRCRPVAELGGRANDHDVVLYHLGNSLAHHAGVLEVALERPGVVVLHEFVLHHLFRERTLAAGDGEAYVEEMRYAAGESGRRAARRLLDSHYPVDVWSFPLFERVVDRARAVVVHSGFARRRVLASRPAARVEVAPFPVDLSDLAPADAGARAAARAGLGLCADAFVVACFGFVTPQKRLGPALAAFTRLRARRPEARFLVAGEISPHYDFDALLDEHGRDGVVVTGRIDLARFHAAMRAADVAVNLRHPTGGETSASLMRLLALGVPAIVTRAGSFGELPDGVVAKVAIDECEEELLFELFDRFAAEPERGAAMGRAARRWLESEHALPKAAAAWLGVLARLASAPAPPAAVPPLAPWDGVDPRVALAGSVAADLADLDVADAAALEEVAGTLAGLGLAPRRADGTGRRR
jgi:glycosyltransferase involved in cell wall biosynthesis